MTAAPPRLTLILGGARSGKSTHAQALAARSGEPVTYIATAQALDAEMQQRVAAHRLERPAAWRTLELPRQVGTALLARPPQEGVVILDCLTLLVSNVVLEAAGDLDAPDEAAAASAVQSELEALQVAIQAGPARWIVVSNEVGLGLVPPYPVGRIYRDLLGWANQQLARAAGEVYWMVAGIPLPIHQYRAG
jgi:adenosylcobinamide kinase/adenosylcobinamide-phosphate guanylyltransferase